MNPGSLNKRITFLKAQETRDNLGGKDVSSWKEMFGAWAAKNAKAASRKDYMGDHVNYIPVFWTIRKPCSNNEVTPDMRIAYNGHTFDIVNITELEGVPAYLEIETKELKPS